MNVSRYFQTSLLACSLALLACSSDPVMQSGPDAEKNPQGLTKVDHTRVDEVYVREGTDFTRYNKLKVDALDFSHTVVEQPFGSGYPRWRRWELTESDKAMLAKMYREVMVNQLQKKGGYTLVDSDGKGVMTIKMYVLEIAPTAPKDDFKSREPRSRFITEGAGRTTVAFEIYDASNGNILVAAKDERDAGHSWGVNNRINNRQDVRQLFNTWAALLRSQLDKVNSKER